MKSKNMNYRFNVEYYKDLKYIYYIGQKDHDKEKKADDLRIINNRTFSMDFY